MNNINHTVNNVKRIMAVGYIVADMEPIIVTEQDALGPVAWTEFITGINAAIAGAELADMQTADEVAGYWWAVKRNGAGEPDYAIEDDYEDIRRGY